MRYLIALLIVLLPMASTAQDWEDRQLFNAGASGPSLRIISSTDTALFAPILDRFVADNPFVSVEYLVTGTADIDRRFRANPADFDLVISSAMDLQLKLANDGYALALDDVTHPAWAQWRQSLYAFTAEPAAIVINRAAFAGHPIPTTRQELIQALRARPDTFRDRIATYDVRKSGLGYLFATQDARASETFWRLMEVMGSLNVRLYCCSGDMIDDLADGTIAVAYNVLGSYAAARIDSQDTFDIILPSDFPITMMRTAMVSGQSTSPDQAALFIKHLIAQQLNPDSALPSLLAQSTNAEQATISLEPALMTFLDALKRRKFLSEWESALIQE